MRSKLTLLVLAETILLAVLVLLLVQESHARSAVEARPETKPLAGNVTAPDRRGTSSAEREPPRRVELAEQLDADAASGVLVHGRVLDPGGNPVDRCSLYLHAPSPRQGRSLVVDPEGRYAAAGIQPGTWSFRANAPQFRETTGTVVVPNNMKTLRHDLVLTRAHVIRVRARTTDGQPLAAIIGREPFHFRNELCAVALSSPLPTALEPDTMSTPRMVGDAEWHAIHPRTAAAGPTPDLLGELELRVDPPAHVGLMLRQTVLAQQIVSAGDHEVLFEFTPEELLAHCGSVRLEVVSATNGQPLPKASVGIGHAQGGGGGGGALGEGARYEATGLAPGLWELWIQAPEHAPRFERIILQSGQSLDLGTIALHPVEHVRGRILDSQGKPTSARVHVDALGSRRFPQELLNNYEYRVNAEGELHVPLGRERYLIRAMSPEHEAAHLLVDATSGHTGELEIRLQPTQQVRIENQASRRDYYLVLVHTLDRLPVWGQTVRHGYAPALHLPHGNYVVDIYRGTTPVRSFALEVGADPVSFRVP